MSPRPANPVVVIGAGLSGLRTADLLVAAGRSVLVLEAAGRIGGRLLRQSVAGVAVDGGGAWVGPSQLAVHALIDELGLETVSTYDRGRTMLELDRHRRCRGGWIPPAPARDLLDLGRATLRLDHLARRLPTGAEQLDTMTFADWLDRHVRTHGARTLLTLAVSAVTGSLPGEVSLLAVVEYVRHAGGLLKLTGTSGGAQDSRIRGGSLTLCERLADRVGTRQIRLDSPVVSVRQSDDAVSVQVAGGEEIVADRVVVATDPVVSGRIDFGPGLSPGRLVLHQDFRQGTGIKFHIAYPRPFWRGRGLSGQLLSDVGLVRLTFDAAPGDDGPGILVGFLGGLGGLDVTGDTALGELMQPTRAVERRRRVVADLVRALGPEAGDPLDYVEQDWRDEPYLAGCVPAPSPGVLTRAGHSPHHPTGRIHWAGTETSHVWPGYMDGAITAAERVVAELAWAAKFPIGGPGQVLVGAEGIEPPTTSL